MRRIYWIGILCAFLSGCQMAIELPTIELDADYTPLKPNQEQRKLAFSGGLFDLKRGDLYVAYPYWHYSLPNVNVGFYVCNTTSKYRFTRSQGYWNEDDNIFGEWPKETGIHVEEALANLGYNVRQRRQSYFDDTRGKVRAELLLSMRVIDIKFNICNVYLPMSLSSMDRAGGNGVITVEWEIYDTIREKSLGTYTTQGYGQVDEPLRAGDKALFINAAADAAKHLGKSEWFKRIMTTMDPVDLIPKSHYQQLTLKTHSSEFHQSIREHFSYARKAVITVRSDSNKQGSGFFISPEGYALTTADLVGDAKNVQIMDVNGTKYVAKVIRTDVRRDVALIKADIKDNFALPISNSKKHDMTETVYAIGTPYQNSYRATIVKGIIAANRYQAHQGNNFIQASLPTAPGFSGGPLTDEYGNVIGLSKTISDDAAETNFSLFIPIQEALKALNIKLEQEGFN